MFKGSCCCGAVNFEVDSEPIVVGTCHCSRCRKVGASTFMIVNKESLNLVKGADMCSTYKPETGFKYHRNFCKNCGTSLGEILSSEATFPVPLNCLDKAPKLEVTFHEFVSEKPDWYEISDQGKQFTGHPKTD